MHFPYGRQESFVLTRSHKHGGKLINHKQKGPREKWRFKWHRTDEVQQFQRIDLWKEKETWKGFVPQNTMVAEDHLH